LHSEMKGAVMHFSGLGTAMEQQEGTLMIHSTGSLCVYPARDVLGRYMCP
jgi:hypothetical protein